MSVINKMLRDLDQRQAPLGAASPAPARPQSSGTIGLAATPALDRPMPALRAGPWFAWVALLMVLAAAGAWWWQSDAPAEVLPASVPADTTAATTPAALPSGAASTPVQATAQSAAPVPRAEETIVAAANAPATAAVATPRPLAQVLPTASASAPTPVVAPPSPSQKLPATASSAHMAQSKITAQPTSGASAATSATVAAGNESQATATRQLQTGREALAQAQSLWAAGSRDAATDLLQQALSLVERNGGAQSPALLPLMSSMVRELARMGLADGRATTSLDLLVRMEPVLGRDADVWAMRGNISQRLGRHQDSVRAYAQALQLRPNEARWLLGSAVSLAALGRIAEATELADRARALGSISKDVEIYLRQAGVQFSQP